MTPKERERLEQEISQHLNTAGRIGRKKVEQNVEYQIAMKQGDLVAALEYTLKFLYGEARDSSHLHRLLKKRKKSDEMRERLKDLLK